MTVIISSPSNKLIVMTADSVITNSFASRSEYEEGTKAFRLDGVGVVTTWGERSRNKLGSFLRDQKIQPQTHSVIDLNELTWRYLIEEYRPKDYSLDEVGYHVGGFDREGQHRLFHNFWGFNRPRQPDETAPDYHKYDHSDWKFVYNGRNDLAHAVVEKLIQEVRAGKEVRYDPETSIGIICFCDFVARFAAELTPEVGPPFSTCLIFPDNSIAVIENDSFCPVQINDDLSRILSEISGGEDPISHIRPITNNPGRVLPSGIVLSDDNPPASNEGTASWYPPHRLNRLQEPDDL